MSFLLLRQALQHCGNAGVATGYHSCYQLQRLQSVLSPLLRRRPKLTLRAIAPDARTLWQIACTPVFLVCACGLLLSCILIAA